MIAFDLQCGNGHTFEGWFEDNAAYQSQKEDGLIECPVCNTTEVNRIPSVFAIKSKTGQSPSPSAQPDIAALSHKIVQFVEKNFDDVGSDFAKQALKMHYGVEEPRNIRGTSTQEEEKTLEAEGIKFHKFPLPLTSKSKS